MLEFEKIFTVDKLLQAYLLFVLIDFITGFLKAYKIEGFKRFKLQRTNTLPIPRNRLI